MLKSSANFRVLLRGSHSLKGLHILEKIKFICNYEGKLDE